jgi:hypothetical protein
MFGAGIGFFAFFVFWCLIAIKYDQRNMETSGNTLAVTFWSLMLAIIIGVLSQWGLYLVVQSAVKSIVK